MKINLIKYLNLFLMAFLLLFPLKMRANILWFLYKLKNRDENGGK